jgi:hypothetical protein
VMVMVDAGKYSAVLSDLSIDSYTNTFHLSPFLIVSLAFNNKRRCGTQILCSTPRMFLICDLPSPWNSKGGCYVVPFASSRCSSFLAEARRAFTSQNYKSNVQRC